MTDPGDTRLYADLAPWWPLLSAPEDYAEEAAIYTALLVEHSARPPQTVLELGSVPVKYLPELVRARLKASEIL